MSEAEAATRTHLQAHQDSADPHFLLGFILFREVQGKWLEGAKEDGEDLRYKSGNLSGFLVEYRDRKVKESLAEFTAGAKYHTPNAFDLKIVALYLACPAGKRPHVPLNAPESYNSKQCVCLLG